MIEIADLMLRVDRHGGPVLGDPIGSRAAHAPRHRYFFLIHGFSVSLSSAVATYDGFKATLLRRLPSATNEILTVAWPGDSILRQLGFWTYPVKVRAALEAAKAFGQYLLDCRNPHGGLPDVVLVGHSLGCRLILEALYVAMQSKRFSNQMRIRTYLMAPAVPGGVAADEKHLRDTVRRLHERVVCYSRKDGALSIIFRAGQEIARPRGYDYRRTRNREAVGLRGEPSADLWTSSLDLTPFGHNDYWRE